MRETQREQSYRDIVAKFVNDEADDARRQSLNILKFGGKAATSVEQAATSFFEAELARVVSSRCSDELDSSHPAEICFNQNHIPAFSKLLSIRRIPRLSGLIFFIF